MYSLDSKYFTEEFDSLDELVDYCMGIGMDPSVEVTKDGKGIGEVLWDFMVE